MGLVELKCQAANVALREGYKIGNHKGAQLLLMFAYEDCQTDGALKVT
jgi:hypothetical protein